MDVIMCDITSSAINTQVIEHVESGNYLNKEIIRIYVLNVFNKWNH